MESLEERLQRETREKVYNLVKEVHIQKPFEDVTGEPHYVTNEIMKIISHTISETIKAGVRVIEEMPLYSTVIIEENEGEIIKSYTTVVQSTAVTKLQELGKTNGL